MRKGPRSVHVPCTRLDYNRQRAQASLERQWRGLERGGIDIRRLERDRRNRLPERERERGEGVSGLYVERIILEPACRTRTPTRPSYKYETVRGALEREGA